VRRRREGLNARRRRRVAWTSCRKGRGVRGCRGGLGSGEEQRRRAILKTMMM
jgi:hypothetical protein